MSAVPRKLESPAPAARKKSPASPPVRWNPLDYAGNSASQAAWAREIIARLALRGDEWILDVGCGDGRISAELAAAVPRGGVTGIDTSPEMLAHAAERHHRRAHPNLEFLSMDATAIRVDRRYDIVFSNAALHWVADHRAFLRGAAAALRPGGRLVVSCGGQGNAEDVFTVVRSELRRAAWREFFRGLRRPYFFHRPEEYQAWLPEAGFRAELVRLAAKTATYAGADGLAAWVRTTWLPYTQRVPESRREEFIRRVVLRYVDRHPPDADGWVHVRMVRLEIEAVKL